MKHIGAILMLSVLCIALAESNAWSQAESTRLVVEVSNGTAHGATVVGDLVTLQLFHHQELQRSLEAAVGETGEAVFADVPAGPHLIAVPRIKHQNMSFQGPPVTLTPARGDHSARVQVFDVSSDTSALSVGTHHITIAVESMSLEFTEYIQLQNTSDMAIRGSKRDAQGRSIVTEIMLPKGARDLKPSGFLQSSALVTTETGFYDTLAVPPGEHELTFSYRIDIDGGTTEVAKEISLPTSELVIFWEEGQGKLTGLGDPNEQLTNAEGVPIKCYRRGDLRPGDEIAFQISGFNVKSTDAEMWIVLAVVFAVVVVIALWRMRSGSAPLAD